MARVEQERYISMPGCIFKGTDFFAHAGKIEISAADHFETEFLQQSSHGRGIIDRVGQHIGMLVGTIADNQSHLFRPPMLA